MPKYCKLDLNIGFLMSNCIAIYVFGLGVSGHPEPGVQSETQSVPQSPGPGPGLPVRADRAGPTGPGRPGGGDARLGGRALL